MSDVAARNKRNKRNGTAWETAIMKTLRTYGLDVERLRLSGAEDEGDLIVRGGPTGRTVIEAKSGALHPAEFAREAITERVNYERHREFDAASARPDQRAVGIAIVKQRGKGVEDGYVLTTVREYFGLRD